MPSVLGDINMQELINEFMILKKFAVVSAIDNPQKFYHQIMKNLKSQNYGVYLVNPKLEGLETLTCYASLIDIPIKVDFVDFLVSPRVTEKIVKYCEELGVSRIWL
jgi:predicted CoA-binding protein